jgi:hypothetical protein
MAKRNSMSTARRSRNRKHESVPQSGNAAAIQSIGEPAPGWAPPSSFPNPRDIGRDERMRLMKAQAVLQCITFALLYEDWLDKPNRPSFADATAVVQELIDETVKRLEPEAEGQPSSISAVHLSRREVEPGHS